MRTSSSSRVPKYLVHKTWGLGVVRINGKDVYLDKYGTPESQAEYRRVVGDSRATTWPSAIASPSRTRRI